MVQYIERDIRKFLTTNNQNTLNPLGGMDGCSQGTVVTV